MKEIVYNFYISYFTNGIRNWIVKNDTVLFKWPNDTGLYDRSSFNKTVLHPYFLDRR
jgi:hypothetical protein